MSSSASHIKYRPDIDGLRAIAVLAVLIYHAFPVRLPGGYIGVDIFFVISGYLISTIIFKNLERNTFSFADFYARRIKRIFPALSVVLMTTLIFGFFIFISSQYNQLGLHVLGGATFVSNLMLWSESGYFDVSGELKPLLHLWSLGIEEQFYIFWPLFLYLFWKIRLNGFMAIVALIALSFWLNISGVKVDPSGTFYSPLTRMWELLLGSLLGWLTLFKPQIFQRVDSFNKYVLNVLPFIAIGLFSYGFLGINSSSTFPGYWPLVPITGAVILIGMSRNTWFNQVVLSHKYMVWFGLISYPLYLWHWPILSFGHIYYHNKLSFSFKIIALVLSVLLAWLTVKFIEKPFRHGPNFNRLKVCILSAVMACIASLGYFVYKTTFTMIETKPIIVVKGYEHLYGKSFEWIEGKNHWMFLGNEFDDAIAKLKLQNVPPREDIDFIYQQLEEIAQVAKASDTQVVLFMGADKHSIYPEYLPDELVPSKTKYVSFFLEKFKSIPNLIVFDSTEDILKAKSDDAFLYYVTDSHWNYKGAYVAYSAFLKLLNLPALDLSFKLGGPYVGDILIKSKLTDYPLGTKDNWDIVWAKEPSLSIKETLYGQEIAFGSLYKSVNTQSLSDQYVWVIGDSFNTNLRPYIDSTFKEVDYLGHWTHKLKTLAEDLKKAERKPNLVLIIMVERSF